MTTRAYLFPLEERGISVMSSATLSNGREDVSLTIGARLPGVGLLRFWHTMHDLQNVFA